VGASVDWFQRTRPGPEPYLFVAIDEYSRFPFVFACSSTTTKTVVDCLNNLFCLFGFPAYAHSDRGSSFMSSDLKVYFAERGIASSRSTPYHLTGNSQCERTNHTVWKTIKLLLHHRWWPEERWQDVLQDALNVMRSLLCTATNETPHERMFRFQRRATSGPAMPTWLLTGARFYFDAMYGTKAIHCVTRSFCWKPTPGMRTSNIATDENILSRRQTSLLVQTRGSS